MTQEKHVQVCLNTRRFVGVILTIDIPIEQYKFLLGLCTTLPSYCTRILTVVSCTCTTANSNWYSSLYPPTISTADSYCSTIRASLTSLTWTPGAALPCHPPPAPRLSGNFFFSVESHGFFPSAHRECLSVVSEPLHRQTPGDRV